MGRILGSPWAGLKYFQEIVTTPNILRYLQNTILISVYSLLWGFPFPIFLAIALNNVRSTVLKKSVQLISYAPYFISTVVIVDMLKQLLSPRGGLFNNILILFGASAIDFMGEASFFRTIYIASGIWQGMGYSAIIFIAALSGVDPNLYEAADLDGISKFQKVVHIDLPTIIMLILSAGNMLSVGFEKVYMMQNPLNLSVSEIISSYVYKTGLLDARYSFSTAVGLLNSLVNFMILITVNQIARKVGETSLW